MHSKVQNQPLRGFGPPSLSGRLEVPLPLTGRVARKQDGEFSVSVSELQLRPADPEDDPEPLACSACSVW